MKRFLSFLCVALSLTILLCGVTSCSGAEDDVLADTRSTTDLDELASFINGDGVVADISSNDQSNTSTVIVTVQSDNGQFPVYVLGKIRTTGSLPGGYDPGPGGTTPGSKLGIEYLEGQQVACRVEKPSLHSFYDLYYLVSGEEIKANIENLPGLKDGDTIVVDRYTFTYSAEQDQWEVTAVESAISDGSNAGLYFANDMWAPVNITSAALKDKCSEGCQWLEWVTLDPTDGKLGFLGVDVGGLFKTTDSGRTWTPCTVGHGVLGSQCIMIDPKNSNHVISVGSSGSPVATAGIYVSMDAGETWELGTHFPLASAREYRQQVVYDPSSYNASKKMCMTVYWSREDLGVNATNNDSHLYRSSDGGYTWTQINENFGGCHLEISADGKVLYAYADSAKEGHTVKDAALYRSLDGGKNFTKCNVVEKVRTIDTSFTDPNILYVGTKAGFFVSKDKGVSFTRVDKKGWPQTPQYMAVAADGKTISIQDRKTSSGDSAYSEDGGVTWKKADMKLAETAFMPINIRTQPKAFAGKSNKRVVAIAGDSVMGSDDGGKTWVTSNLGYNAICTGDVRFNINNNDLVIVPSQDYNGAFSTDGGDTWTYLNWSGHNWGGMTYSGYIMDKDHMAVICTVSWASQSSVFPLYTTSDGGKTFNRGKNGEGVAEVAKGASFSGFGAVGKNNIAFIGNLRTTDYGKTWKEMTVVKDADGKQMDGIQCYGVFTADLKTGRLYGVSSGGSIIYSDDDGASWNYICSFIGNGINSMGVGNDGSLFVSTGDGLLLKLGKNSAGVNRMDPVYGLPGNITSVVVDYNDPKVVYIGHHIYSNSERIAVQRSLDGGKTWTTLNKMADGSGNPITKMDGGKVVTNMILNYKNNELWVVQSCRGIARIPHHKSTDTPLKR